MNFAFAFSLIRQYNRSGGNRPTENKKNTMEKSLPLSRSQSVDERSVGLEVDGDSVRERSVHGGSREASFRGGNANANDRSFRGGDRDRDRDRDRSVHSTSSAVPPSSSRPPLPTTGKTKGLNDNGEAAADEVELGHHHGLSVAARPAEGAAAAASGSAAAAASPPALPHAKFYLEEYDHDLYGAPLWAWPRVRSGDLLLVFFSIEGEGERERERK